MKTSVNIHPFSPNLMKDLSDKIIKSFRGITTIRMSLFKPQKEESVYPSYKSQRLTPEKHYHRKWARPLAEKQTLLKEKKK